MSEKLSLEVKRPSSMDRLQGDSVKSDPVFIDNLLTFPVAYGLALQGLNELSDRKDYGRINTNLLPPHLKTERLIRSKKPYAAAAAAALLLGTGVLAFGYGGKYNSVKIKDDAKATALGEAMNKLKNAASQADSQAAKKKSEEDENRKTEETVKAIIKGNDNRADMVRLHESILAALPKPGNDGNMKDPALARYWAEGNGPVALEKMKERIRGGKLDNAAIGTATIEKKDDTKDYSEALATVQIESIFVQYSDDLKGFLDKVDKAYQRKTRRNIADVMNFPDSEAEEKDEEGKMRRVPKLKDGKNSGYVVQISGFTTYQSDVFLKDVLVGSNGHFRNLKKLFDGKIHYLVSPGGKNFSPTPLAFDTAKTEAERRNKDELKRQNDLLKKDGKPTKDKLERYEEWTVRTKVEIYLPDLKGDPVLERISHVMLLKEAAYYNPQPGAFQFIDMDYITQLIPPPATAEGAAAPPAGDQSGQPTAATAATTIDAGWSPFKKAYSWDATADSVNSEKPKGDGVHPMRREFVLCFIWQDEEKK
jgi:hypothetical protein